MTDENTQAQDAPQEDSAPQGEAKTYDEDYVKELRSEAAKWRVQLRDVQAQLNEVKQTIAPPDADKETIDKADPKMLLEQRIDAVATEMSKKVASMVDSMNGRVIKAEFKAAALAAGVPDDRIEAAAKLADLGKVKLQEDGTLEGLPEVVNSLVESNPFLVSGTNTTNVKPTNPSGNTANDELTALERKVKEKLRAVRTDMRGTFDGPGGGIYFGD